MDEFIPIMFFCLATSISPGPNNIMLMTSGLNHGAGKTLPHLLGIIVGFPLMVAVVGLGLGALFLAYPAIHLIVKVLGITYLLFLAWKMANSSNPNAKESLRNPLTFLQAASFQWANPKAWVIASGAISTFTSPGNIESQVLKVLVGYITVGSLSMAAWLFLGVFLKSILHNKRRLHYFNISMATLLVLSVIPMALTDFGNAA